MTTIPIHLSEKNQQKLTLLTQQTGKTADDLVNEAVAHLEEPKKEKPDHDWRASLRQARGMWKDRDDLPAFYEELRKEWDRRIPGEGLSTDAKEDDHG